MKLIDVADTQRVIFDGIVLSPQEYLTHDAYHPFERINEPTLFISYDAEPAYSSACWTSKPPDKCDNLRLIRVTGEELSKLEDAGYRLDSGHEAYALTSVEPTISCYGTSYRTLIAAREYAHSLRQHGLCSVFSISGLYNGIWAEVYRSS